MSLIKSIVVINLNKPDNNGLHSGYWLHAEGFITWMDKQTKFLLEKGINITDVDKGMIKAFELIKKEMELEMKK